MSVYLVAAVAYWCDYPLLVLAASVPYFLHLVMHLIFWVIKQDYVPGAVTSVLELPIGGLYVLNLSRLIHEPLLQWVLVITVAIVIFVMNLGVIHWGMAKLMRHF
nr:HXXEE domain-containing protein [Levilactobacillus enshiensis]